MFLIFNLYVHSGKHLKIIHWVWPRKTFFKCDIYQVCINYTLITLRLYCWEDTKSSVFTPRSPLLQAKGQTSNNKGKLCTEKSPEISGIGQVKKKMHIVIWFWIISKRPWYQEPKFCLCWRSLCWASHVGIFYLCHQPWIFNFPHSKTPCKAYTNHKFYY